MTCTCGHDAAWHQPGCIACGCGAMGETTRHGSYAGYQRHKKRGEPACDECRKANAAWQRQYRTTAWGKQGVRRESEVREAALRRLIAAYRGTFDALLREERDAYYARRIG